MKLERVIIPPSVRGFDAEASLFDVYIENGAVAGVNAAQSAINKVANGMLLPAFVDLHVHIDKTYVVNEVGAADGDLFQAINLMAQHRSRWTQDDIRTRMERALQDAYTHGTRALRTHLDWPDAAAPKSLAVFEQLREMWRDRLTLQCVSLTPLDVFDDATTAQTIAQQVARANRDGSTALLGAFVYRNDKLHAKLQRVFALAQQHHLQLDFHVDEGLHADARGLRAIAELTIHNQYQGKVTCGHACSLSVQPAAEALDTLRLCAQAGIHLVALPSTNLYLQGAWDATPVERGITRLKEALAGELSACIATDNVADGFYPYGSYDLLETYGLGVLAAHLSPADAALSTITTHPARAMGLAWDGKIRAGCPADLVLLSARSPYELLSPVGRKRQVMRGGEFLKA
jgi:cytosine/creatinine deaminase